MSIAGADFDRCEVAPGADRALRDAPVALDIFERSMPEIFEALIAIL
jgi:hypothetical protein